MGVFADARVTGYSPKMARRGVKNKRNIRPPKAITATTRKLACVMYHLLKYPEDYVPLDVVAYYLETKEHRLKRLPRDAKNLGLELVEMKQAVSVLFESTPFLR